MKSNKQKIQLTIILISIIALSSCWYNHKWEDLHPNGQNTSSSAPCDSAGVISYSLTIQPIIQNNCATGIACHISHGTAPTNYNNFTTFQTDALTGSGSGTVMTRLALPSSNSLHMPQNNQTTLAPCDTIKLRKWIKEGCPQN